LLIKKELLLKGKKRIMARPKKYQIDTAQVKKLSSLGCTNKEMEDWDWDE
jgi:hypothetical protein